MPLRLGLLLLVCLGIAACSAPSDPQHDWPAPSPALWQVTSPDGPTGWLFGTVHSLPETAQWRSDRVDEALDQAGILYVEIAELGDVSVSRSSFDERAYSAALPPLTQRVPPADRALVASLISSAGAAEADFARMETWAAAMTLAGANRLGDPRYGVDRQLLALGKQVVGLESYAEQFRMFDDLPQGEQADLLLAVAREAQSGDPVAALEHWLTGDMDALEAYADGGLLSDPELRMALRDARNLAWIARIAAALDRNERPFVAVGSAHMLGSTGLPALLAGRGYRVERIQ